MPRDFFDHTGDIGVRLTAPSLPELFREAALAFTDTLLRGALVTPDTSRDVHLAAPSLDDLMVEWLGEVLYWFEVQNVLTADATLSVTGSGDGWELRGALHGEPFDPARHPIQVLVKGITYHRLDVRETSGTWQTDVVFDI